MTESADSSPTAAEAAIARSKAKRAAAQEPAQGSPRPVRTKPARGGRFLATGAAVGLSLAAVGAMSAATQAGDSAPAESSVQRVVRSQPIQTPQQIVIVLPGADPAAANALVTAQSVDITGPAQPTPPAPAMAAPAPVTESGGS